MRARRRLPPQAEQIARSRFSIIHIADSHDQYHGRTIPTDLELVFQILISSMLCSMPWHMGWVVGPVVPVAIAAASPRRPRRTP